jgi:hypothetical protein
MKCSPAMRNSVKGSESVVYLTILMAESEAAEVVQGSG